MCNFLLWFLLLEGLFSIHSFYVKLWYIIGSLKNYLVHGKNTCTELKDSVISYIIWTIFLKKLTFQHYKIFDQ